MDKEGKTLRASSIYSDSDGKDMFSAKNGLVLADGDLYFAGWATGFNHFRKSRDSDSDNYDAFVYKYRFNDA